VQGHPPGFVLLLWSLNMLGLRGTGWVAAIEIAGGAAMVAAAVIAVRELAGDPAARAASPFVALAPSAIWVATSADAFFGGVSAWGVALFVLASNREGGRSVVYALAAGMLLGCALHLSYATLLLGLIVIAVGVVRGSWQAMLVAACGLAAVAAAFYAGGFWWFAGLAATLARYRAGVASTRPFAYFALSNLAAFGAALGPAVAVGLARLRDRRAWLLVGPALMAVAVANLSGLSKGEVERIWLPFTPWLLIAGCALPPGSQALWLAIQALVAVAIQTAVRTPW